MFTFPDASASNCRRYVMPACEPDVEYNQSAPIGSIATFQLRQRDVLDFGIDFSAWLAANGGSTLTGATWSVATGSPHTPSMVGDVFDPSGEAVITIGTHAGAMPGDAYWLDVVADISPTTVPPVLPARRITRRIYIVVVQG